MSRGDTVGILRTLIRQERELEEANHYPRRRVLRDLQVRDMIVAACDVPDDDPGAQLADRILALYVTGYAA